MTRGEAARTLYAVATAEMKRLIKVYLDLTEKTTNFAKVSSKDLRGEDARRLLLAGIGSGLDPFKVSAADAVAEWERRQAVPFDVETSITTGVYIRLREAAERLYGALHRSTGGFSKFEPAFISANPQYLPLLQHIGGLFSKAQLKRQVGSVNDTSISAPAAQRLAAYLRSRVEPASVRKGEVLRRLDSTFGGHCQGPGRPSTLGERRR